MRVFRVEQDGCVHHWCIAQDSPGAIALVKEHSPDHEPDAVWEAWELPMDVSLSITLGTLKITHTAAEWLEIYDYGLRYLACSEF